MSAQKKREYIDEIVADIKKETARRIAKSQPKKKYDWTIPKVDLVEDPTIDERYQKLMKKQNKLKTYDWIIPKLDIYDDPRIDERYQTLMKNFKDKKKENNPKSYFKERINNIDPGKFTTINEYAIIHNLNPKNTWSIYKLDQDMIRVLYKRGYMAKIEGLFDPYVVMENISKSKVVNFLWKIFKDRPTLKITVEKPRRRAPSLERKPVIRGTLSNNIGRTRRLSF